MESLVGEGGDDAIEQEVVIDDEDVNVNDEKFFFILKYFWDSMEAVYESAIFAHQNAQQLDDQSAVMASITGRHLPSETDYQRIESTRIVQEFFEGPERATYEDSREIPSSESDEEKKSIFDHKYEQMLERFSGINSDPMAWLYYMSAFVQATTRPERLPVIFASLLTSAVGNFEVLIAGAIREFVNIKPEALRADETKYSLAEIEAYPTIQDFRDACVDRYAENILRGSFEDWMKWFEKSLKIRLNEIVPNVVLTLEIFQRRHLFVHNGGVVNRLYLAKLPELASPPPVGRKLVADISYLLSAIDNLTAIGVLLISRVVCTISPSVEERRIVEGFVSDKSFECLGQERYQLAIDLTSVMIRECLDDDTRLIMKVNRWIAQKRLFGLTKITTEVESWQTSTLEPRYKLAKFALLDRNSEALDLGKDLIGRGELSQESWETWPLLSDVRAYEEQLAQVHISSGGENLSS